MTRFLIAAMLLTILTGRAWAGFQEGLAAFYQLDYETALREWRPLAEQGDPNAQYQLGLMHFRGEGVPQDYRKALTWYRRAADQGDADAQLNLGLMYAEGYGVPQDFVQAHKWFNLAAAHSERANLRALAVRNRENAASMMTLEQISKAQKLAHKWKPKRP